MKHWSIGYEILRTYVRFAFWLTHKSIVVTGRKKIPRGKPIIFAPNHQNALMDPLALACTNKYQSVWLARADIFKSKAAQSILKYLKLLPVYRIRDGKENLSNNEQIFRQVIRLLEEKQTVALFPEAGHSGKRKMLLHKKAIPRIALEAEEKNNFNLDVQIIPVGIYYSHYWDFNRSVVIEYGEPIRVSEYKAEYTESPQKAMMNLRNEIYCRLVPLTHQINSEIYYQEYVGLSQIVGKAYSDINHFSKDKNLQLHYAEKNLVQDLEQLEIKQPHEFDQLIHEFNKYQGELSNSGLSDLKVRLSGILTWRGFLAKLVLAILSVPVFVFGFLFNAIPHYIPRLILRRKVKDDAFLSTFYFVSGVIMFPLFYILSAYILYRLADSLMVAGITLFLMPFGGKFAFQILIFYRNLIEKFQVLAGGKSNSNTLRNLLIQRNKLVESVLGKVKI